MATIKIEAGKYYLTREGEKVGPMVRHGQGWTDPGHKDAWFGDGTQPCDPTGMGGASIISEWTEAPKFKVGDRVRVKAEYWPQTERRGYDREFTVEEVDTDGDVWYSSPWASGADRCVCRGYIELIPSTSFKVTDGPAPYDGEWVAVSGTEPAFTVDWPHGHVTRDGRNARVVCTDRKAVGSVVALVDYGDIEDTVTYDANGHYLTDTQSMRDLLNAPAPKREWWVNVYGTAPEASYAYSTRATADFDAGHGRLACIHVTEGDGL